MSVAKHVVTAAVTSYLTFALFLFLDTPVPDGIPEVWNARILDAALRINGKVILTLHDLGVHGGVTWWTRKMVDVVLTTLITGSPFGKGDDPEIKIWNSQFDGVDVRVYEPVSCTGANRPVLIYYHGGGWSWLSVEVYDPAMRELAKRSSIVIVSVGYRQSPEHAHPIPYQDCLTATEYVFNNAHELKVDPARVAVSGDSAGGHLAVVISLRLKKKIKIQIPIYPCLQMFDLQTPSYIENKKYIPGMLNDVSMLSYWLNHGNISYTYMEDILANNHTSKTLKKMKYAERVGPKWYMPRHIRTENLRNPVKRTDFGNEKLSNEIAKVILDPYFAPLMTGDYNFVGLPLTYVLTAGYDVLRDDGLIYAQRLKKAGVKVHLAHYREGFHGMIFFFDGPIPFEVGKRAMNDLIAFLKKNL